MIYAIVGQKLSSNDAMVKESKMNNSQRDSDLLIADLILRVNAIEKILINKNVCTADDLIKEIKEISKNVIKFLEQKQANEIKN